jgi:hypothetical protein
VEQITRIGMDMSKHIFELHGVTAAQQPAVRKKLRRKEMVTFFEKLALTVIACSRLKPAVRPSLGAAAAIVRAFGEVDRASARQAITYRIFRTFRIDGFFLE